MPAASYRAPPLRTPKYGGPTQVDIYADLPVGGLPPPRTPAYDVKTTSMTSMMSPFFLLQNIIDEPHIDGVDTCVHIKDFNDFNDVNAT